MIILLFFLLEYSRQECTSRMPFENLFLSPKEKMKLNLQDYIYGKSIQFEVDNINETCLQNKTETLFHITHTTDITQFDISSWPVTNQWKENTVILDKNKIVSGTIINNAYAKKNSFSLQTNNYYQIAILGQNISIIDYTEADKSHQCFLIYNDTGKTGNYQCLGIIYQESDFLEGFYNEIDQTFYFFKSYQIEHSDVLYQFRFQSDLKIAYSEFLTAATISSKIQNIKINDIHIYNNGVYSLIYGEKEGIVLQNKTGSKKNFWNLNEQFDQMNIYTDSAGSCTALLSNQKKLMKYSLSNEGSAIIIQKYGVEELDQIVDIYHNNQYVIASVVIKKQMIIALHKIWVFDSYNRIASNLFVEYDAPNKLINIDQLFFDPVTIKLILVQGRQIYGLQIQSPILTIDPEVCKPQGKELKIKGESESRECQSILIINQVQNQDQGIYSIAQKDIFTMSITSYSVNSFLIKDLFVGPNVNYQAQIDEGLTYFLFKNQTDIISYPSYQLMNLLQNRCIIDETTPLIFYNVIQTSDPSKTIVITKCNMSESQSQFICTEVYASKLYQTITVLMTQSYIKPLIIAYTLDNGYVNIIIQESKGFSEFSVMVQYFGPIKSILYEVYNYIYICADDKIDLYKIQDKTLILVHSVDINELSLLINMTVTKIFSIHNQYNDYFIYVATDIGLILLDTGLFRFGRIQVASYYLFPSSLSEYQLILVNHMIVLQINTAELRLINFQNKREPFYQLTIPTYNYDIVQPLKFTIGQNSSLLYLGATQGDSKYFLVYKLRNFQQNLLYTQIATTNLYIPSAISIEDQDYLFYVPLNDLSSTRIYEFIQLVFISPKDGNIDLKFTGMNKEVLNFTIQVEVKNSEKQLDITLINNKYQYNPIIYNNLKDDSIILSEFHFFVNGSVGNWSMKCQTCENDLKLVNYIDFGQNVSVIPNIYQIKHSIDYVFIQQKQNLTAIDSQGILKYIIPLPITISDPNFECQTLSSSTWIQRTKLVVSVCNSNKITQFFITSFLSSQPFPLGPFSTDVYLNEINHARLLNDVLFVLDSSTDYLYLFDIGITNSANEMQLQEYLNAQDYTKDNQQNFVNFDVAIYNEEEDTYMIFVLTNKQQLILIMKSKTQSIYDPPYQIENYVNMTDYPTNVIPLNIIVSNTQQMEDSVIYTVFIINQNYHHFEFQAIVKNSEDGGSFSTIYHKHTYLQYGYYVVSGKSRVSEPKDGFFGVIYRDPLTPNKSVLVVYDTLDYNDDDSQIRKLCGSYEIDSDKTILFDFLHKPQTQPQNYGIILSKGSLVQQLNLSRQLKIQVKNKQFKNQLITFTASNDFDKQVIFNKEIYNETGRIDSLTLWIMLGAVIGVVLFISGIVVKRELNKKKQTIVSDFSSNNDTDRLIQDNNTNTI